MARMNALPADAPAWVTKDRQINELIYCCSFLSAHPMKCIHGRFFTVDGQVPDEGSLKQIIFDDISEWKETGVARKVDDLLKTIKLMAYSEDIPLHYDRIHVANGTWYLDGSFSEEKEYCRNRLMTAYNPNASTPNVWLRFLSELLVPEDILTIQEYLGYCLLPTTKAQKMLMLIGKGGEGKSRIGLVMRSILGINMNTTSIQKVEKSEYARADLEDRLLMVDDDMDMSALTKTNYIKSIVTSECQMDVERKHEQSYQTLLYVRFLCFGNGALTALHDRSDGFFRRQIVITTKDKPEGRVDDPYLVEKMTAEDEGILLWCLEGLKRLVANDYRFTISERSKENIAAIVKDANNIPVFLTSEGYLTFHEDSKAATSEQKAREEKRSQIERERVIHSPRLTCRPILVTDFLTRTTIKRCAAASHDIEDIQVAIKVLHKNYTVTVEIVPALHCKTCNKYYLLETEYQELKAKGILLCNVVEQSYWSSSQKAGFYITNQESLLHKMGYSVSANNSLLMSERHAILRAALDNGLLTKAEILSHLDYLIRRSRNQSTLNAAVEKWKDDREYVRGLSKNAAGVYYEAKTIIHRSQKEV